VEVAFQMEAADANPTGGGVEEAGPVPKGDSGGSSKIGVQSLTLGHERRRRVDVHKARVIWCLGLALT
jgi:hypothetical protein